MEQTEKQGQVIKWVYGITVTTLLLAAFSFFGDNQPSTNHYGNILLIGIMLVQSLYQFYKSYKEEDKKTGLFLETIFILVVLILLGWMLSNHVF
ncbi:hypothetical protein J2R98_001481 [Alkalibacillus filiformis]|uniref:Cytochrome c oxidase subunit 4 n=1 Tax=Alkalibacillus filiformis TaxID=200990 RepID=A0ABU0DT80_9BACI|nr:hypothetical protein [Alkalibacillus filiformis]MDQ0351664.1 hypothetical protein [Alkalibacillus filiformis]